jgi:probable rRNA maturation factor
MELSIDIQNPGGYQDLPAPGDIAQWLNAAWQDEKPDTTVLVRIVDEHEGTQLNLDYRGKDYATNILSFPFEAPPIPLDNNHLGDLVLCHPVVLKEAQEQHKNIQHHWAHLLIHGMLHLQGYDHLNDDDAEQMESLEIKILKQMGYQNPYKE